MIINIIRALLALAVGGAVGVIFGMLQNLVLRRNEQSQQTGSLNNGWAVMPGSMRRVACLLVALVLVQIFCPLLFQDGSRWFVSIGAALGYGGMLLRRLWQRKHGSNLPGNRFSTR